MPDQQEPERHLLYLTHGEGEILFWCPGCKCGHVIYIKQAPGQDVWTWNGSKTSPTFHPSVLVNSRPDSPPKRRCHLFVRDGMLEFLPDCDHVLAGQTVPMQTF